MSKYDNASSNEACSDLERKIVCLEVALQDKSKSIDVLVEAIETIEAQLLANRSYNGIIRRRCENDKRREMTK